MKVAIIGCGRSGTKYTAQLLQSAGLDFPHEDWGEHGGVGWVLPISMRCQVWQEADVILHQVREPWVTISSLTTHTDGVWNPVQKVIGTLPKRQPLRAAAYWVRYNKHCAELASCTYRVEDLIPGGKATHLLCSYFGVQEHQFTWPSSKTNKRRHSDYAPRDFTGYPNLLVQIQQMGREYGY